MAMHDVDRLSKHANGHAILPCHQPHAKSFSSLATQPISPFRWGKGNLWESCAYLQGNRTWQHFKSPQSNFFGQILIVEGNSSYGESTGDFMDHLTFDIDQPIEIEPIHSSSDPSIEDSENWKVTTFIWNNKFHCLATM